MSFPAKYPSVSGFYFTNPGNNLLVATGATPPAANAITITGSNLGNPSTVYISDDEMDTIYPYPIPNAVPSPDGTTIQTNFTAYNAAAPNQQTVITVTVSNTVNGIPMNASVCLSTPASTKLVGGGGGGAGNPIPIPAQPVST